MILIKVFEGIRAELAVDDAVRNLDKVKSGVVFKPQKAEYCGSANESRNASHINMQYFSLTALPALYSC